MIDAGRALRTAYLNRLQGVITGIHKEDGGIIPVAIPVYDSAAVKANAKPPYVLLSSFYSSELGEGTKQTYGQTLYLLIDIVSQFSNSFGGKAQTDEIAEQVLPLIRTRPNGYVDMGNDWEIITTLLEQDQTLENLQTGGMIVRRLLRFQHKVVQLTNNG